MEAPIPIISSDLLSGLALKEIEQNSPSGRLLLAGDLYPGGRAEATLVNGTGETIWGDLAGEMARHDLCIANLECPLTENETPILKSGPSFRANPECARGILAGGFDTVSLANNHIKDMGSSGVIDSLDACERAGLRTVGAGRNLEDASRPLFVSINGLRIGIIAIAEQEFSIADRGSAGAWPLDLTENFCQIQAAKDQADFVLVILHGGVEYYSLPTPALVKTCRFFVDSGADGVVCHHTHVPSGMEIYNAAPIVYSTGNFLFDWWPAGRPQQRFSGYMVSLEVQKHTVTRVKLVPYFETRNECRVCSMDSSESSEFLSKIVKLSVVISDENLLYREYEKLVRSKHFRYLSVALMMGRVERRLYKIGIRPFWRTSDKQLASLRNQFSCQSHNELMLSVLDLELRKFQK